MVDKNPIKNSKMLMYQEVLYYDILVHLPSLYVFFMISFKVCDQLSIGLLLIRFVKLRSLSMWIVLEDDYHQCLPHNTKCDVK